MKQGPPLVVRGRVGGRQFHRRRTGPAVTLVLSRWLPACQPAPYDAIGLGAGLLDPDVWYLTAGQLPRAMEGRLDLVAMLP
jgi:hypothetical protein